jgi:ribosomal protein S18 acetylase RimI-like enzyme
MPAELDVALACRLERHAAGAWPATIAEPTPGGWLLRATPGLDRGRSNNALTPCRALEPAEIAPALARVHEFARDHRIRPGIQVSPLPLHGTLQDELDDRGWTRRWPVLVLSADREDRSWPGLGESHALEVADQATDDWLATWARCEPDRDVASHAATVFPLLAGQATFARLGEDAVAISVDRDGLVGLFCLAVDPARRRAGLGTAMVRALLARAGARIAYLQVEEDNAPAVAMYARLGFSEAYRYCHRHAPGDGSATAR